MAGKNENGRRSRGPRKSSHKKASRPYQLRKAPVGIGGSDFGTPHPSHQLENREELIFHTYLHPDVLQLAKVTFEFPMSGFTIRQLG